MEVDETGSEGGPKGAPAEKHGRAGTKRCRRTIKSRARGESFKGWRRTEGGEWTQHMRKKKRRRRRRITMEEKERSGGEEVFWMPNDTLH